ncbi:hypothetical protein E2C01_026693 [Portunus trituberculatus]|uniref:Uncharacterized protein n=1 Tax=Portunus trituberculatus TaxID=210409 RepID=A0A5B7EIV2_PORTR|nr:hypothetical protein [Portunus trituberculatus]
MSSIKILRNDVYLNPRKAYGPEGIPLIVLKYCASVLAPCLTSTSHSCLKFAYIHLVPKKGDRPNSLNYRPIALISCLSKVFFYLSSKYIGRFSNIFHCTIFSLIASKWFPSLSLYW